MRGEGREKAARRLGYVILFALVIRVGAPILSYLTAHDPGVYFSGDTGSYLIPAQALLDTGTFSVDGVPEVVRTPGYPLFLLPGILSGHLLIVTIGLQILASLFTIYLVYRIAIELFDDSSLGVLCALFYAIEPLSILYASELLTETLFTTVTTFGLYHMVRYLKEKRAGNLAICALAVAASAYIRPVSLFLPLMTAGLLVVWGGISRPMSWRRLAAHVGLFLVLSQGSIEVWKLRNRLETGYPGFSAISAVNMYYYLGASVLAAQQGIPYYEMQNQLGYRDLKIYEARHPEQVGWSNARKFQFAGQEGARIVFGSPMTYARIHLEGILRTLVDPGSIDYMKFFKQYPGLGGLLGLLVDQGLIRTALQIYRDKPAVFWSNLFPIPVLVIYLSFSLVALGTRRVRSEAPVLALVIYGAYFLFISGGPAAYSRFRHTDMPVICVLAGYGLVSALRWRAQRRSGAASRSEAAAR